MPRAIKAPTTTDALSSLTLTIVPGGPPPPPLQPPLQPLCLPGQCHHPWTIVSGVCSKNNHCIGYGRPKAMGDRQGNYARVQRPVRATCVSVSKCPAPGHSCEVHVEDDLAFCNVEGWV
ncbi:hypothetical protein O9K51_00435 [Purpureocillium lavendulum]|uniref:Uncharacterized protein n=1 Tax=Purpureocillium lavendulum TaxID=1247861 RepID=A0AB34G2K7_9HYPO|nr:hypothetical protein O9K51_00435 [Purpureocillium lavendulum]